MAQLPLDGRRSEWVGRATGGCLGPPSTWQPAEQALTRGSPGIRPRKPRPPPAWAVAVGLLPGSSEPTDRPGLVISVCGYFYPAAFLSLGEGCARKGGESCRPRRVGEGVGSLQSTFLQDVSVSRAALSGGGHRACGRGRGGLGVRARGPPTCAGLGTGQCVPRRSLRPSAEVRSLLKDQRVAPGTAMLLPGEGSGHRRNWLWPWAATEGGGQNSLNQARLEGPPRPPHHWGLDLVLAPFFCSATCSWGN